MGCERGWWPPRLIAAIAGVALVLACGGGGPASGSSKDPLADVKAESLVPSGGVLGKGPNGEQPVPSTELQMTSENAAKAQAGHFKVGIVMQTMNIDWSTLQVRGMTDTLKKYGVEIVGVTDANFKVDKQVADIQNMIQRHPDAIISIPVDDTATAAAYKQISEAGIKLVLILQVPRGLTSPQNYATTIASEDQNNGATAANEVAHYVPKNGTMGIIGYGVDFFTTNQRELGVKQWIKANRPDIKIKQANFLDPNQAGSVAANFLTANPDVKGLWVAWDAPAMEVVAAERQAGKSIPISTMDLGNQDGIELAKGGLIKGIAAQRPYDEGTAEAVATIKTLVGDQVPPWVVVPGVPVIRNNVLKAYDQVWHTSPPAALTDACKSSSGCGGQA
jgi:ribose transport system substrate-binding protein